MTKPILRAFVILGLVYLAVTALLFLFQRQLIYAPDQVQYVPPSHYEMLAGVDEIALEAADGVDLTAWYSPAPAGRPTVVMFLGKSGSLRSSRYRIQLFRDARMGVLMLAYRGFSGSDGVPTEQGLYADARAALDWLHTQGVPENAIVLYGVSLGSGVATAMAAERDFGALVLEAPYTSVVDVAAGRFPVVPVRFLMIDRFDSLARIADVGEQLLVMHGDSDHVIPQHYGRQLFDAADDPKLGFWPEGVGHRDLFDRGGFDAAREFIESSVRLRRPSRPAPRSPRSA